MSLPSRRDFLKVLTAYLVGISGVLGLAGIGRYLSFDSGPRRKTEFDLGPAESVTAATRTRIDEIPALIIADDAGIRALSLQCTHLGCTVEDVPEGYGCPCHGSQFDSAGEVRRGPARKPLPLLRVEVNEQGHLIVYID